MVVEICNAKVTYSVKQLTADCVDETSVHHGFNVDNDYNKAAQHVCVNIFRTPGLSLLHHDQRYSHRFTTCRY